MSHLTIYFFSAMSVLFGQYSVGQNVKHQSTLPFVLNDTLKIPGNYEGVICFRMSECCTTKLVLMENQAYKMKRIVNNHGRKNKSTEYGTWEIDGEILLLNRNKTKDDDETEPEQYKVIKGDLWYFSLETLAPIEIALKRK